LPGRILTGIRILRTFEDVLLDDNIVFGLLQRNELPEAVRYLFDQQISERIDLRERYNSLSNVLIKKFDLNNYSIELHYNPGRIQSTSARIDKETILQRDCFLCYKNLPTGQKGVLFRDYIFLVNPFPIFPQHFTIAHKQHIEQRIDSSFRDLLLLSKNISPYLTLFYNGPECGASAPDHLHFQGGAKGSIPLEKNILTLEKEAGEIIKSGTVKVSAVDDGCRKIILLTGTDLLKLNDIFLSFLHIYRKYTGGTNEPMLNIIVMYDEGQWKVCILLREKHRPAVFFSEGEDNFLVSPAAADLGGIIISPLKKDFDKADANLLLNIYKEVSLDRIKFEKLKAELRSGL
jgi:hypothetical protein